MEVKQMSIREDLVGDQFVPGNIKTFLQQYNLFYYPPEVNFPSSKVWLYLRGKQLNEKINQYEPRYIKSLCFSNIENHRNFILNNLVYHLYWLEKQGEQFRPDYMDIGTYRMRLLEAVVSDIRSKLIKRIKERMIEVR